MLFEIFCDVCADRKVSWPTVGRGMFFLILAQATTFPSLAMPMMVFQRPLKKKNRGIVWKLAAPSSQLNDYADIKSFLQLVSTNTQLLWVEYHHWSGTFTLDNSKFWLVVDKSVLPATKLAAFFSSYEVQTYILAGVHLLFKCREKFVSRDLQWNYFKGQVHNQLYIIQYNIIIPPVQTDH